MARKKKEVQEVVLTNNTQTIERTIEVNNGKIIKTSVYQSDK